MVLRKWVALISLLLLPQSVCFGFIGSSLYGSFPSQTSAFVLPIVKRDSLLNGLQLVVLEQQGTGTVSAHLRINTGALFDLAGKGGLSDLTSAMLLKGAGGLNAKNISETIEQSGLTITVTSNWDSTDIVASGPADSLETIFDLLGKFVIAPSFDQKEFDSLKTLRIEALNKEAQDDAVKVKRRSLEVLFGSYPFGRPVSGTPESIAQIARQDLVYFHNRFYLANSSELFISGDSTAEQVTRLARSKLGAWKKGEKIPPTFRLPDSPTTRRIMILDRSDEQPARAAVVQPGVSRRAEDYFAALIMSDVLAQQISKVTAGHSGTTVDNDLETRVLAGPLIVNLKSAPGDLTDNLNLVLEAMSQMQTSPAPSDRVESAKAKLIASLAERLKSTSGAGDVILDIETYGLGRDYVIRYADRVNALTSADIQRAAQTYLKPQSVTIVIAGSAARFESQMKKLGTVVVAK